MQSQNNNQNTAPVDQSTGSGLGTKARGVVEVVHGAFDNLRGIANNEELEQKGRTEIQRGLAKLKGDGDRQGRQFTPGQQQGIPAGYNGPGQFTSAHGTYGAAQNMPGGYPGGDSYVPANMAYPDRSGAGADPRRGGAFPQGPQITGQFPPNQYGGRIPPGPGGAAQQPVVQHPGRGPQGQSDVDAGQYADYQGQGQGVQKTEGRSVQAPADPYGHPAQRDPSGEQDTYHHREDGISGIPQNQLKDIQARAAEDHISPDDILKRSQPPAQPGGQGQDIYYPGQSGNTPAPAN